MKWSKAIKMYWLEQNVQGRGLITSINKLWKGEETLLVLYEKLLGIEWYCEQVIQWSNYSWMSNFYFPSNANF